MPNMIFAIAAGVLAGAVWMGQRVELPPPMEIRQLGMMALSLVCMSCLLAKAVGRLQSGGWRRRLGVTLVILLSVSAAASVCAWHAARDAHRAIATRLTPSLNQQSLWIEATVKGLPNRDERGWRFEVVRAKAYDADGEPVAAMPGDGLVYWYSARSGDELPVLRPGQRLGFQARLRQPGGPLNPGGFDAEAWMLERGLHFSASIQTGRNHRRVEMLGDDHGFLLSVDRLRWHIRHAIDTALTDSPHRHVLSALVVGDQRAIPLEQWSVFQRTGTAHLMSISGLHVTMLAALAGCIGAWIWRLLCRSGLPVALWIPVPCVRAAFALAGAMAYALLAGFAIPAQRTAWMVLVLAIATMAGVRAHRWAVLCWALVVVLMIHPMAVLSVGFWLSFVAVALLFTLPSDDSQQGRRRSGWLRTMVDGLRGGARAQLAITLGLLPLGLFLFQQVSVIGPVANSLAIPVVSFLVTPLAMAGVAIQTIFGNSPLLQAAATVQACLMTILTGLASVPMAVMDWPSPGIARTAIATAGVVVAMSNIVPARYRRARHLGWLALLALWSAPVPQIPEGRMEVSVVDVGQGSSIVIRTRSHSLVFDTGPAMGDSDAGARQVMPALRRLGIRRIDRLVVSHLDQDHSGGAASLLALSNVSEILTSDPSGLGELLKPPVARSAAYRTLPADASLPPINVCRAGLTWSWDGVRFQFLHPSSRAGEMLRGARRNPLKPGGLAHDKLRNDLSCVLRVEDIAGGSILLTGDISVRAESHLAGQFIGLHDPEDEGALDLAGARLQTQVLLAAHHGSRTSTGDFFLDAVAPELVIIQAGYRNRYGHPHADVMERIRARSDAISVARTDLQGALTITWSEGRPVARDFFQDHRRYWHARRTAARDSADMRPDDPEAGAGIRLAATSAP